MAYNKKLQVKKKKSLQNKTLGRSNKFSSWLPEVYAGNNNRIERYRQYESMDLDSEINASLDILAEFCTQENDSGLPFEIDYLENELSDTESQILRDRLRVWCKTNNFTSRLFEMFRQTLKYGDQFFIRDPETHKWIWIDPVNVEKVIVDESKGKKVQQYVIKDLDLNLQALSASPLATNPNYSQGYAPPVIQNYSSNNYTSGTSQSRFSNTMTSFNINAEHVIHLSMSTGTDTNWPFGNSVLESIYKVHKQKTLLEDAIVIYRIIRASEKRAFYIDTGNLPENKAMAFVERMKNEIHQRRVPSKNGGSTSIMDASYDPISITEDFFFPVSADGRGSKVETLPAGDALGSIDDLKYFNNKLIRGLRIPSSYLPTGPDDGTAVFNDGKVGSAMFQEKRFNEYCIRIQKILQPIFDLEFKLFLKTNGYMVDSSLYQIKFNPPMNFAEYRELEVNQTRAQVYSQVQGIPHLSERFKLKKYLGLTDDEIKENEKLWKEENKDTAGDLGTNDGNPNLRSVGVSPMSGDMGGDLGGLDNLDTDNLDSDINNDMDMGEGNNLSPIGSNPLGGDADQSNPAETGLK